MKGYVSPVADNTRTGLSPRMPSPARQIVPMKRFVIEFALRPGRHVADYIALTDERLSCSGSVCRPRELILKVNVAPDTHEENPSSILSNAKVSRVDHVTLYPAKR